MRDHLTYDRRGGKQLTYGPSLAGRNKVRRELGQWMEHKRSLAQAWMRNLQIGLFEHNVAVQQDVEVNQPGAVAATRNPAHLSLDLLQTVEKGTGWLPGDGTQSHVEKTWLIVHVGRQGLIDAR